MDVLLHIHSFLGNNILYFVIQMTEGRKNLDNIYIFALVYVIEILRFALNDNLCQQIYCFLFKFYFHPLSVENHKNVLHYQINFIILHFINLINSLRAEDHILSIEF